MSAAVEHLTRRVTMAVISDVPAMSNESTLTSRVISDVPAISNESTLMSEYACEVCHELRRLYTVCNNGHTACDRCIKELKRHDAPPSSRAKCPTCRGALLDKTPMNVFAVRIASRFGLAPCDNVGCPFMVPIGERVGHLAVCEFQDYLCPHCARRCMSTRRAKHEASCESRPVQCKHSGCVEVVPFKLIDAHLVACPCRLVRCTFGCGANVIACALDSHALACERRMVTCENDGCDARMEARALQAHAMGCPHRVVACDKCGNLVRHAMVEQHFYVCSHNALPCLDAACSDVVSVCDYAEHMRSHGYVYRHGVGLGGVDVADGDVGKFAIDLGSGAILAVTVVPSSSAAPAIGAAEDGLDVSLRATTAFSADVVRVDVKLSAEGVTIRAPLRVNRPGDREETGGERENVMRVPAAERPVVSVSWD